MRRSVLLILAPILLAALYLTSVNPHREPVPTAVQQGGDLAPRMVHRPRTPSRRFTVQGHVLDADGNPVEGAQVCATCVNCQLHLASNAPNCVTPVASGSYALALDSARPVRISAFAPGCSPATARGGRPLAPASDPAELRGVDITLDRTGVAIRGNVRDVLGGPVGGARLRGLIISAGDEDVVTAPVTTKADVEGGFTLWVPASAQIRVVADADGYSQRAASCFAPAEGLEIILAPSAGIAGSVFARADGNPVAGVTVHVDGRADDAGEYYAVSDDAGDFQLQGVQPGTYVLDAEGGGWRGMHPQTITVDITEQHRGIALMVDPAVEVTGYILVGDGEQRCLEGIVHLGPAPGADVPELQAHTGETGKVRFAGVVPGRYEAQVACRGYRRSRADVLEVGDTPVATEWRVEGGATVVAHTVDDRGRAVAGVSLQITPHNETRAKLGSSAFGTLVKGGTTDEEGRFAFHGLPAGRFGILAPGATHAVEVVIPGSLGSQEARVTVQPLGELVVHVRNSAGAPVDGLAVYATRDDEPGGQGTPVGQGDYRISQMPMGDYAVYARDGMNGRRRFGGDDGVVAVRDVERIEVELNFDPALGEVTGVVLDDAGAPVENVWVRAVPKDFAADAFGEFAGRAARRAGKRALTGPEGAFNLRGLEEGIEMRIEAERALGGRGVRDGVRAGDRVEILLPRTGSLAGTARSADDGPVGQFMVEISNTGSGQHRYLRVASRDTRWDVPHVSPGEVRIVATTPTGDRAQLSTTLKPGAQVDGLVLRFSAPEMLVHRAEQAATKGGEL